MSLDRADIVERVCAPCLPSCFLTAGKLFREETRDFLNEFAFDVTTFVTSSSTDSVELELTVLLLVAFFGGTPTFGLFFSNRMGVQWNEVKFTHDHFSFIGVQGSVAC